MMEMEEEEEKLSGDQWRCEYCTLINKLPDYRCVVCDKQNSKAWNSYFRSYSSWTPKTRPYQSKIGIYGSSSKKKAYDYSPISETPKPKKSIYASTKAKLIS